MSDPPAVTLSAVSADPLWAFRLRAGRDSELRVQPRQTDAVIRDIMASPRLQ